jgi:hypothetical protein
MELSSHGINFETLLARAVSTGKWTGLRKARVALMKKIDDMILA